MKEIEKAWKLVDVSQEKESRSKEVIDQLQYEMDQLQAMVKEKSGIGITEYRYVTNTCNYCRGH